MANFFTWFHITTVTVHIRTTLQPVFVNFELYLSKFPFTSGSYYFVFVELYSKLVSCLLRLYYQSVCNQVAK
jgi:hypothetical protein